MMAFACLASFFHKDLERRDHRQRVEALSERIAIQP